MALVINKRINDLLDRHFAANLGKLSEIADRLNKEFKSGSNSTLGGSERNKFLIATGIQSEGELIAAAKVVHATKRCALIQIGDLLYAANKYGATACYVTGLNGKARVWGPDIPMLWVSGLFKGLGIDRHWDGSDYIHDYSGANVTTAAWMH